MPCQLGHRCLPKREAIHTLDQPVCILTITQVIKISEVQGVSSMKLNENNERFLRTMAEAGKTDMVLGLFRS